MKRDARPKSPPTGERSSHTSARGNAGRAGAAVLLLLAIAAFGCSSAATVKTKSTTAFDVSAYRTYDWATQVPVVIADEERERDAAVLEFTIRDATDRQLAAKGYAHAADGARPDFLVDFGVRLEEKATETFGEYIAYRDLGGKQGMGPALVFGYEEGTLVLEVTDARSRERAWTGSARTVLDDGQDVSKLEAAVGRILTDFPDAGGATPARARGTKVNDGFDGLRPPEP